MRKGGLGGYGVEKGRERKKIKQETLKINNMHGGKVEQGQSRTFGKDMDKDIRSGQWRVYFQE